MNVQAASPCSIRDIRDPRAKAMVRGLLNKKLEGRAARSALAKLLSTLNGGDLLVFDSLVRNDRLFRHLNILPEFPPVSPFGRRNGYLVIPNDALVITYICHRARLNSDRLVRALAALKSLNLAILVRDDGAITESIDDVVAHVGHSLVLARKLAFIVGYADKDTYSHNKAVDITGSYGAGDKNYGMMATVDSIGSEFNYLDIKSRFAGYAEIGRDSSTARKLSYLCFNPISLNSDALPNFAAASYGLSLLDAVYALLIHRDLGISADLPSLGPEIEKAWDDLTACPLELLDYFNKDQYSDIQAFRSSSAFLENARFRSLRAALQPVYDLPDLRRPDGIGANRFAAEFYSSASRLEDLLPRDTKRFDFLPKAFDANTSGSLARSCGIVWICEANPDFSGMTASSMASLMGHTTDVDRLLSTATLRKGAETAIDPFVKLILHTLLRAHSSATKDSYNFKEQFQHYVRQYHDGNILSFMDSVRNLDPHIVQYFVNILDETMLSQMAFLMSSSDAIYETRACLLEWYAKMEDHGYSADKAKRLRLDRKIAAVRGAINETRLNIDSVRFRQWIEQNKLTDFSDFIRQKGPNLPSLTDLTDKSKAGTFFLSAHREPSIRALAALVECYSEFCKNVDFGIASFLGRRIRHGTLRGTLLDGIPDSAPAGLPHSIGPQYYAWKKEFSSSINSLASRLHFLDKSSYKNGLISAEIDTPQKWQACLICLGVIFENAQKDHGILGIPLFIEQYCWFIFELELPNVQAFISNARNKWGTLKFKHLPNDDETIAFEKSTDIVISGHFNTVMSWFKKPPNISPVAEVGHVLDVVLQEARAEYSSFFPELDFIGDKDLKLSGSIYYVVYDALTIAVRNAAKHGECPGKLGVQVVVEPMGQAQVLSIAITSNLRADDCPVSAIQRIKEAGHAGAQDADIVEGLSGMRKLKKMELERGVLDFSITGKSEPKGGICVSMRFPFVGLVE